MADLKADSMAVIVRKTPEQQPQMNGSQASKKRKISREKYPAVNLQRLVSLRQENTLRSQPTIYNREQEVEKMNIFRFAESNIILHSKRKRKLPGVTDEKSNNKMVLTVKKKKDGQKKKHTDKIKSVKSSQLSKKHKAMLAAISDSSAKHDQIVKKKSKNPDFFKDVRQNCHPSQTSNAKKKSSLKVKVAKPNLSKTQNVMSEKPGCKAVFKPVVVRTNGKTGERENTTDRKTSVKSKNGLFLLNSPTSPGSPPMLSDSYRSKSFYNQTKSPPRTGYTIQAREVGRHHNSSNIYVSRINRFSMQPKFEEISVKHFEAGYVHITICPKKEQRFHFNPLDPDEDEILTKNSNDRQKTSPASYNCLTPSMLDELITALESAQEGSCKAVLLSSVGSIFSAGFDLRYFMYHATNCDKGRLADAVELIRKFVDVLIHFTKPIVVAVQGPAIGMAASLLCLCDIVLADVKSSFCFPYTHQGLAPDCCSSHTLPTLLKPALVNSVLYGSRTLTPGEARDQGIVSEVIPHDSFMRHVIPRVRDVCTSALVSLTATKRLIRSRQMAQLVYANECESRTLRKCLSTPECLRTMQNYVTNHLL